MGKLIIQTEPAKYVLVWGSFPKQMHVAMSKLGIELVPAVAGSAVLS